MDAVACLCPARLCREVVKCKSPFCVKESQRRAGRRRSRTRNKGPKGRRAGITTQTQPQKKKKGHRIAAVAIVIAGVWGVLSVRLALYWGLAVCPRFVRPMWPSFVRVGGRDSPSAFGFCLPAAAPPRRNTEPARTGRAPLSPTHRLGFDSIPSLVEPTIRSTARLGYWYGEKFNLASERFHPPKAQPACSIGLPFLSQGICSPHASTEVGQRGKDGGGAAGGAGAAPAGRAAGGDGAAAAGE